MWGPGEMSKRMCLETELGLPGNPIQGQQKHSCQDRQTDFDGERKHRRLFGMHAQEADI